MTQALTAVISCKGVMVNVCPKDAAASCERFFSLQKVSRLHHMLPLSPPMSMPVFAVSCCVSSPVRVRNPKASQYL